MRSKLNGGAKLRIRSAKTLIATALLAACGVVQIDAPVNAQAPTENVPAEKFYKNIQVFKGLPSSQLMENMHYMEGALGLGCNGCHVNWKDFEKDGNPRKQTARRMIEMVRELNQTKFGGQTLVTCNTCHRGHTIPVAPLAFAAIKDSAASKPEQSPDAAAPENSDQVFERYISATNANAAAKESSTVLLTGSMSSSEGWTAPLKIYVGARDKLLVTFDVGWISYNGFNGAAGWERDNNGVHDLTGKNLAVLMQKDAIFHPAILKAQYSSLTLRRSEIIDGHLDYVVEGARPGFDSEKLYFDANSGLLVRIQSAIATSLGALPHQLDLKDYRNIGGLKIPFEIDDSAADFSSVYKIAEGKPGVLFRVELFEKPVQPLKGFPR